MSVETPWPLARRPWARSITVTSPSASSPSPTAETMNWLSSHSVSTAAWIAPKTASTGPSPPDSPSTSSPDGVVTPDPGERLATGSGLDLEPGQLVLLRGLAHLVGDDRLEIERRDLLLLVRQRLEPLERLVERVALDDEAELLQRVLERMAAGVLAEHDLVRVEADVAGIHDLERRPLLEDAVLVDARLVGERVAADDRLVRLHDVAGEARDHPAGPRQLGRLDASCRSRGRPVGSAAASRSPRASSCRPARRSR